jgi:hypothetical protein
MLFSHCVQSTMSLAAQCGYPPNYFHGANMAVNSDEDLEIERNDVREVVRVVAGATSSDGRPTTEPALRVASRVLLRLLQACAEAAENLPNGRQLIPETAAHAFSALAKPLIFLAQGWSRTAPSEDARSIFRVALHIMAAVGQQLVDAFPTLSVSDIFPVSRLFNLAVASLSPMLAALIVNPEFEKDVLHAIHVSIKSAALSIAQVPELAAPSTLLNSRHDIRGAMRTPGGEDHAGCLVLKRLSAESVDLAKAFARVDGSLVTQLCNLYEQLKDTENQRGQGVFHGRGVVPKSRRILLSTICHLEAVSAGATNASGVLRGIFDSAIASIVSSGAEAAAFTPDALFCICENVFDLAAFSPTTVATMFDFQVDDIKSPQRACLEVLHRAGLCGFGAVATHIMPYETLFQVRENVYKPFTIHSLVNLQNSTSFLRALQWNRLRAAVFTLLQTAGSLDFPPAVIQMAIVWIRTECEAILFQCSAGPTLSSPIFRDDLISEEVVPAGLLVRVAGELVQRAFAAGRQLDSVPQCIRLLYESRRAVLQAITSECPDPVQKGSFCDPRPTLCEAWLLAMGELAHAMEKGSPSLGEESSHLLKQLLVDSCSSCICILLYPTLGKTQEHRLIDPGMSLDGPQTLVLMDFLQKYFALGPSMFLSVAANLMKMVPIDAAGLQQWSRDPAYLGISIIGAALFRAAQGGLPPWGVELLPSVYASLFKAMNEDPNAFGLLFQMSMHVRLSASSPKKFGGLDRNHLVSGRFFENMSDKTKETFVAQAVEIARQNNGASWRRLKAVIKQACGGKKKDTDFKQRPTLTKWEMDRA